ncbi:hypothetical protein [Tsukamurella sp. 1534]|uniref:hypothetical protein n=1 Tax=Tsukamurella sp. 1534 TaxID=1151061 RepID=UPI001ED9874D|nr:hypothetical protein [Tsukamurella sp. 1534]
MDGPLIWPRMDRSKSVPAMAEISDTSGPKVDLDTSQFSFSSVGTRANRRDINALRDGVVDIANQFGFNRRRGFDQEGDPGDDSRARFDLQVLSALPVLMPMNWSEAGSRDVWSWCALALLPDVTHWRWRWVGKRGTWNTERWIGSDLTRHSWARQWWRAVQFEPNPTVLDSLMESDFNQLTERATTIGANPVLVSAFAAHYLEATKTSQIDRRHLIRDAAQRLLREMAFVDDSVMSGREIEDWVLRIIETSTSSLQH